MIARWRAEVLERLETGVYDLVVVGAGIVGARVAFEAARCGLRIALVDGGDIGSATSSASSKLVHGGLRYLGTGQARLVRQLTRERALLETVVAPGLVRPLPMVVAATAGGTNTALLPVAITLYRALARTGESPARMLRVDEASTLVPALRTDAVTASAVVHEATVDDARLTLATVQAASEAGADVLTYATLGAVEHRSGVVHAVRLEGLAGEGAITIRTRALVNATGPWVDEVRRLDQCDAYPLVRLAKGVNVLLRLDRPWPAALALFDRSRSVFVVPRHGMLLIGATDTPFEGDPASVAVHPDDVTSLCRSFDGVVVDGALPVENIVGATAGLRVLPREAGPTTLLAREALLSVSPSGMVSVAGGKLTTHRPIAQEVLRSLPADVRPHRLERDPAPVTTNVVASPALDQVRDAVGDDGLDYLVGLYGGRTAELERGRLDAIAPGGPDCWAQATRARDVEWALCVDDVVRRRTTLELRGLATPEVRRSLGEALGLPQRLTRPTPAALLGPIDSGRVPASVGVHGH